MISLGKVPLDYYKVLLFQDWKPTSQQKKTNYIQGKGVHTNLGQKHEIVDYKYHTSIQI